MTGGYQPVSSGFNNVDAYLMPGIPWVTGSTAAAGSTVQYTLPCATRFLLIRNTGAAGSLAIGFTLNGMKSINHNFFTLTAGQEENLRIRTAQIFVSASSGTPTYEIVAGLSIVPYKSVPIMSSSISGSDGVVNPPIFSGVG